MLLKFLKRFLLYYVRRMESTQPLPTMYEKGESEGWSPRTSHSEFWSDCSEWENIPEKTDGWFPKYESIHSAIDEYKILGFLRRGKFGKVAKCPKKGSEVVTVKIWAFPDFTFFNNECSVLQILSKVNPDKILKACEEDETERLSPETSRSELSSECSDCQSLPKNTDDWLPKYKTIHSANNEYKVLELLGDGGFGKVVKCLKKGSEELVAVKISKFPDVALFRNECLILQILNLSNPDKFNFIRNMENFLYENQFHMVFEMLEKNLYEHMKENHCRPLPMEGIRRVTHQLLVAQDKLRSFHIIHGDLKPENIMLVNHQLEPFRIKVIDFGVSILIPARHYPLDLGTVTYRAPDVTLGLDYYEAADMWSTGCIVAEMLTGEILYPGNSPYDQLRIIDQMLGPFPVCMLCDNEAAAKYFCCEPPNSGPEGKWRLKHPEDYFKETGIICTADRKHRLENLDGLLKVCSKVRRGYDEDELDRRYCIDMIKDMLQLHQEDRIFPDEGLECNFICRGSTFSNSR